MEMSTVYKNTSDLRIVTARHALNEAGIATFILNKSDSAYVGLFGGEILINVAIDKVEEAMALLRKGGYYDAEDED